jgi:hypothetical protein
MKKTTVMTFALVITCMLLGACEKKSNGAPSVPKEEPELKADGIKITNDIDSVFKVQAQFQSDLFRGGGGDLGIVGAIENGNLTISVPAPQEEMLHWPSDLDLGSDTEGMKIAQLNISTSNAYAALDNRQSGGSVYIWFANKDGVVDFYGVPVSLKQGWNFVEGFQGNPVAGGRVWTALQDVYEEGYYRWILVN